jgi:hypothetical protein
MAIDTCKDCINYHDEHCYAVAPYENVSPDEEACDLWQTNNDEVKKTCGNCKELSDNTRCTYRIGSVNASWEGCNIWSESWNSAIAPASVEAIAVLNDAYKHAFGLEEKDKAMESNCKLKVETVYDQFAAFKTKDLTPGDLLVHRNGTVYLRVASSIIDLTGCNVLINSMEAAWDTIILKDCRRVKGKLTIEVGSNK